MISAILALSIIVDTTYSTPGVTTVWVRAEYHGTAVAWKPALLCRSAINGPLWFSRPIEPDWQDGRFAWWLLSAQDPVATFAASVEETR